MKKKIAIIGAGIAGLTLANLLKKNSDYEFMLYEKQESLALDEGFGIPLIESMKSEVPIICSDIEVFKEIGGDSALYFKAGNHIDLYEKLNILINDSDLRKNLVKLGKENVKRFNRNNFIKEFEKIYN